MAEAVKKEEGAEREGPIKRGAKGRGRTRDIAVPTAAASSSQLFSCLDLHQNKITSKQVHWK